MLSKLGCDIKRGPALAQRVGNQGETRDELSECKEEEKGTKGARRPSQNHVALDHSE